MDFLRRISPDNIDEFTKEMKKFKVTLSDDCPAFDGLFEFCQMYTAGSIDGAKRIMSGEADIAINWSGGLHHAKKASASGFCYVNDIVLAILQLLKKYPRVLYIDIDVHHGDGVEEAFYLTNRVMTVSFHRFGQGYFPETGDVWDRGAQEGLNHSVNVPLHSGIDDESYEYIFKPVIRKVFENYQPSAVVLQCGADSLAHDPIGQFNLTLKGHGECVKFVKSFKVPTLVLGGGGYNIKSVARCWAYETALLLGQTLDDNIPSNDYWQYFDSNHKLHFPMNSGVVNDNDRPYLDTLRERVFENLRNLDAAPSVPFQDTPKDDDSDYEGEDDPDKRPFTSRGQSHGEFFNHDRDQGLENKTME